MYPRTGFVDQPGISFISVKMDPAKNVSRSKICSSIPLQKVERCKKITVSQNLVPKLFLGSDFFQFLAFKRYFLSFSIQTLVWWRKKNIINEISWEAFFDRTLRRPRSKLGFNHFIKNRNPRGKRNPSSFKTEAKWMPLKAAPTMTLKPLLAFFQQASES